MAAKLILSFFLIQSFVYLASTSTLSPSSQCGKLTINCPFHLKGSPALCKDGFFEVVCEGNNAFLYIEGYKILITEISGSTLRLIDPAFVPSLCPLPSLPSKSFRCYDYIAQISNWSIVAGSDSCHTYYFFDCPQPPNDQKYIPVPCLSVNGSKTYVFQSRQYLSDYGYVTDIPNSCQYLASTVSDEDLTANSDIPMILQKGFIATLTLRSEMIIDDSQLKFSQCLKLPFTESETEWNKSSLYYRLLIVLPAELMVLDCLFTAQKHFVFALEVVLTFCGNVAVLLLVGRIIAAPLVTCVFLMYKYWKTFMISIDLIENFLRRHATFSVRRYEFSDIVAITSHFREKLGQGGFGAVYKGEFFDGSLVAVKMLNDSKFGGDDFINEVGTIGKIHHTNIVQLIGFCSEGSKRALIYEYMPNGSLDKYIFSRSNGITLTIEKRKEIAIGIARGIDYLHRGCEMQILHFDIKPHNILLDSNLTPKLSDFGMAKLYSREYNSVMVSAARGTIGYIAPELVSRNFGTITHKADVYSFGMLLLELAGGKKNVDPEAGNQNQVYYPSWIYDQLAQKEKDEIFNVTFEITEIEGILAKVGLWCIQCNPLNRPSMNRVIEMLQMKEDNLEMPPKPFAGITQEDIPTISSIMRDDSGGLSTIAEEIPLIE